MYPKNLDAKYVYDSIQALSSNKFVLGMAMLMLNIGSKHLSIDMGSTQEQFFQHVIVRRITLFCIFFIATRDLFVSIVLTALFVVLVFGIVPSYYGGTTTISSQKHPKKDYTRTEYEKAKEVILSFESQNQEVHFCKNK